MFAIHGMLAGATAESASAYRYWRVHWLDTHTGTRVRVDDLRFSDDGGSTTYPPDMTSDSAPSPYVALAGEVSAGPAWNAFDSSADSSWNPTADDDFTLKWLQVDLGVGVQKSFNWIQAQYRVGGVQGAPTALEVYASNTGAFAGEEVNVHSEPSLSAVADATPTTYSW